MQSKNFSDPLTNRGLNLPPHPPVGALVANFQAAAPDTSQNLCLGYDWIEFTATIVGELPNFPFMFEHEQASIGTQHYKELYNVSTYVNGEALPFCQLQLKPRVCFIDTNVLQVKIDNRFCYNPNILTAIKHFCREYGLTFKNYIRLDLFIDFQKVNFYDSPNDVMKLFKSEHLRLKAKRVKTYARYGKIETVSFGSRSSTCMITMYNKTIEMRAKTNKPWVSDLWKLAAFDEDKDTYRLEFSIKKQQTYIVDADGLYICNYAEIDTLNDFKKILDYFYNQHFAVAYFETRIRFSRLHQYHMLAFDATTYFSETICQKPKSNNYTKSYIKRLCVDVMFLEKRGEYVDSSLLLDHVHRIVERHHLGKWFDEKMFWFKTEKSHHTLFDMIHSSLSKGLQLRQANLFKIPPLPQ